jgi:hypothetical protein
MTSLIRVISAFFLALAAGLIVSTANGLDIIRALQGSVAVAWVAVIAVGTISVLINLVRAAVAGASR